MNRRCVVSKESKARYQHYKDNLYREAMERTIENRNRLYYGMSPWEIPSILDATIHNERWAKREARKMVRWDKRTAKANGWKLSEMPRTEWAAKP